MATRKYGISLGENHTEVTEAVGSAVTDNVEVTIDLAAGMSRQDAILALQKVQNYIAEHNWPPA
jgi:L-alanine-DL-glutamate epimerase-like enolase superfamily enzyme